MSSKAAPLFWLLVPFSSASALGAGPLTAEQAMANYRKTFEPAIRPICGRGQSDEILVCGRRTSPDPNRLPLPVEHEAGERSSLVAGDVPRSAGPPPQSCPNGAQVCGGGLVGGIVWLIEGIKTALDKED